MQVPPPHRPLPPPPRSLASPSSSPSSPLSLASPLCAPALSCTSPLSLASPLCAPALSCTSSPLSLASPLCAPALSCTSSPLSLASRAELHLPRRWRWSQNNLAELYALLSFVAPSVCPAADAPEFMTHFAGDAGAPGPRGRRAAHGDQLEALLLPLLLRRTAAGIELGLPPLTESVVYCPMSPLQVRAWRYAFRIRPSLH